MTHPPRTIGVQLSDATTMDLIVVAPAFPVAAMLCPPASLDLLMEKFAAASIERVICIAEDFAGATATHFSWMKDSAPIVAILRAWVDRRVVASR